MKCEFHEWGKMYIEVKNERNETILYLHVKNNKVDIVNIISKRKSWVNNIWEDSNQEICYEIITKVPEELVEQISNDALLDELRSRMVI